MNYIAIVAAIILGYCVLQSSANKDAQETQEATTKSTEHVTVSGTPSPWSVALCVLVVAVIVIAAVLIL